MSYLLDTLQANRLYLTAAVVAFAASVLLTPLVRWLARKLDIVDRPDNHRKLHDGPIPLGGGIVVLLAFLTSVLVVVILSSSQRANLVTNSTFLWGVVASAVVICGIGVLDDRFTLRGRQKLIGQVVAAGILILTGLWIDQIELFGYEMDLGPLAAPFTLFWLLGAINCLNLLDGVDGLATSVGVVLSLAIAAMAAYTGHRTEAFLALSIAGALIGFLCYNSPPASIFLGDAGSMLIGLMLGALAIRGSLKGPATAALAAPAAIWAIPIIDVSMAILRRRLTGRSIYTTDRGHLHHILLRRGLSGAWTVVFIGTLCLVTAIAAVFSVSMNQEWLACVVVGAVFGMLVLTGIFGQHECRLVLRRAKGFVRSLFKLQHHPTHLEARLQGNRQWDDLWETLTVFAERFDLASVQLNIQLPAHGEEYHAAWQRRQRPKESELWSSDIPLTAHHQTVGRLLLTGSCANGSVCGWMSDLIAGLQPFETQMLDLLDETIGGSDPAERAGKPQQTGLASHTAPRPAETAAKGD